MRPPLRKEVSVTIKLLDAIIPSVCYIDVTGGIYRNTFRDVKIPVLRVGLRTPLRYEGILGGD